MASKTYCDLCNQELLPHQKSYLSRYFQKISEKGDRIIISLEVKASSIQKKLLREYQRELRTPDLCTACIRKIVIEGEPLC